VLGDGLTTATHLPGGTILVSHQLVENYETPEVAAGYILAERVAARRATRSCGSSTGPGRGRRSAF
jgi:hypothetical protein